MGTEHSARKYDIFEACRMANEEAAVKMTTGDDIEITWTWDDKIYVHSIPEADVFDEVMVLHHIFRCATHMAKM